MFVHWVNYSCPKCGDIYERRVVNSLRLGPEIIGCLACGHAFQSGEWEWIHLPRRKRVVYFFPESMVAALITVPLVAFLAGWALSDTLKVGDGMVWATLSLLLLLPVIAATWWLKIRGIRESLERCPLEPSAPITAGGLFPWDWKY